MTIKVKMSATQAVYIALVYGHELEPTTYGSTEHARVTNRRPDPVRRAIIQLALDTVRRRADEALEQLIDEAVPQARADHAHLIR